MGNKFGMLFFVWLFVSLAYVILALIMPMLDTVTTDTAATLVASSNMSNYPGTQEAVTFFPLIAWFIPGGLGIGVTIYALMRDD